MHKPGGYGIVAYWLRPTAYNGVNGVQFPAVLLDNLYDYLIVSVAQWNRATAF